MDEKDVIVGDKYHHGTPDGPIVIVCSKHNYIDNHYYIRFEEKGNMDTTKRERLFPI